MKQTLIVMSDYSEIRRKANRIYIRTLRAEGSLPITSIDGLLIFGKATITSDAISLCMTENIPILLLTQYGHIKAQILPPISSEHTRKRTFQYYLYLLKKLEVAKFLIASKLLEIEYIFECSLEEYKSRIPKINNYHELLGIEGSASKEMFKIFANNIKVKGFKFEERSYHPPKDEINALLSFIYTLGYNFTLGYLLKVGYDPYISFLHVRKGRHAAFASDVLEILRPRLTKFAMDLIDQEVLEIKDWERTKDYVKLKRQALVKVLEEFNGIKEELLDLLKV
jgi:CRISPR-associated protein Cas1